MLRLRQALLICFFCVSHQCGFADSTRLWNELYSLQEGQTKKKTPSGPKANSAKWVEDSISTSQAAPIRQGGSTPRAITIERVKNEKGFKSPRKRSR